jgi:acyl CoA:acetate/3-ketoacid CoA transferase beta subunit
MVCDAARELRDGEVVFVDIGLPTSRITWRVGCTHHGWY